MLQRTSAETLPMQLNSVRHIEPYKGSMEPQDLLDLYVGNYDSTVINKILRSPNIEQAHKGFLNEQGITRIDYKAPLNLPDEYNELISSMRNSGAPVDIAEQYALEQQKTASDILLDNRGKDLSQPGGEYFPTHPLNFTPGFQDLPLGEQANQITNYKFPERLRQPLSLEQMVAGRQSFNEYLSKIPHLERTVLNQPKHEFNEDAPLSRGLEFKHSSDYNKFINQYQPGQIIEYPSFKSTSDDPSWAGKFGEDEDMYRVFQNFQPIPGSNQLNARDANNPYEGEWLYPPGQRFKIVESEPSKYDVGTHITLQETNELTPVEQRTNSILSRMKPRIASLA